VLWNKYYVDEIYDAAVVVPTIKVSDKLLWKVFDIRVIDRIVNGSGKLISFVSGVLRKIQVGVAQSYALAFVVGTIVIIGILMFR
jgi:NADH-quinone oxidoreductase subunit L